MQTEAVLQRHLDCCNGYLARIGDPPVTDAIVAEIADVLELPIKEVRCFAMYGRLSGFVPPSARFYAMSYSRFGARFFPRKGLGLEERIKERHARRKQDDRDGESVLLKHAEGPVVA